MVKIHQSEGSPPCQPATNNQCLIISFAMQTLQLLGILYYAFNHQKNNNNNN